MKPVVRGIFLTDTHMKGTNPRGRRDDYSDAILTKTRWVVNQAVGRGVDIVLHGGDWFDTYDVGNSVITSLIKELRMLTDHNIPLVGVYGSHDVHGYQSQTIQYCSIGILEASGLITLLRRGDVYTIAGADWGVVGCPHTIGLDESDGEGYYLDDPLYPQHVILLAHGTLVDKPLPDGFNHTLLSKAHVRADIVFSGDYHTGYETYIRDDGVVFSNPGAVARLKTNDMRQPSILYFELFASAPPSVRKIPIDVAGAASNIFDNSEVVTPTESSEITHLVNWLKMETGRRTGAIDVLDIIQKIDIPGVDGKLLSDAKTIVIAAIQKESKDER